MANGEFRRVEKTSKRMYGPRKLLACGFPAAERKFLHVLLEAVGLADLKVVFAGEDDLQRALMDILRRDAETDREGEPAMRRAGIMSGLTQEELHRLLKGYRESGLPSPLWATLTPVSEKWKLEDLLRELAAEAEAIEKRKRGG